MPSYWDSSVPQIVHGLRKCPTPTSHSRLASPKMEIPFLHSSEDGLNVNSPKKHILLVAGLGERNHRRCKASYPSTPRSSQQGILQFCRHPRRQPRQPSLSGISAQRPRLQWQNQSSSHLPMALHRHLRPRPRHRPSSWRRHSAHPYGQTLRRYRQGTS